MASGGQPVLVEKGQKTAKVTSTGIKKIGKMPYMSEHLENRSRQIAECC